MNHDTAADLREALNSRGYVEDPHDSDGDNLFGLVRVQQPGYLNGEPMYEVILDIDDPESIHLPTDFLELVTARDCYIRLQEGVVHIRDWET